MSLKALVSKQLASATTVAQKPLPTGYLEEVAKRLTYKGSVLSRDVEGYFVSFATGSSFRIYPQYTQAFEKELDGMEVKDLR
jgi:hypothetical protein